MYYSLDRYNLSIRYLVELLVKYTTTKWKHPANYFLGDAYRLLGDNISLMYYDNKSRIPYYESSNQLFNKAL